MSVTSATSKSYMSLSVVLGENIHEGVYIFDQELTNQLFTTADNELEQQGVPSFRSESNMRSTPCKYYYPEGFSVENLQDEQLYSSVPSFLINEAAGAMSPEMYNPQDYENTWASIGIYIEAMKNALAATVARTNVRPEISEDQVTHMYIVKLPRMQRATPKMTLVTGASSYEIKFDPTDGTLKSGDADYELAPAMEPKQTPAIKEFGQIKPALYAYCEHRMYYKDKFDHSFTYPSNNDQVIDAWERIDNLVYELNSELAAVPNGKWSCTIDVNDVEFSMSNQIYFPFITFLGKVQNPQSGREEEHKFYVPLITDPRIVEKIEHDHKFVSLFLDSHKTKTTAKSATSAVPKVDKIPHFCNTIDEFVTESNIATVATKYNELVNAISNIVLIENETGYITYPEINIDPSILGTDIVKFSTNQCHGIYSKHIINDERLCNPLIPNGIGTGLKKPTASCSSKPANVDEKEYLLLRDFFTNLLTDKQIPASGYAKAIKCWRNMINRFLTNYALVSRPTNSQGKPTGKKSPQQVLSELKNLAKVFQISIMRIRRNTQGYLAAHQEEDGEELTEHKIVSILDMILGNINLAYYLLSSYFDDFTPKFVQKIISDFILRPEVIKTMIKVTPDLLPYILPVGIYNPSYPQMGQIYNGKLETIDPFNNLLLTILRSVNDASMRPAGFSVHSCFLAPMTKTDGSDLITFTRILEKLKNALTSINSGSAANIGKDAAEQAASMSFEGFNIGPISDNVDIFSF